MKRVLIYGKNLKDAHLKYLDILLSKLKKEEFEVFFYLPFLTFLIDKLEFEKRYKTITKTEGLKQFKIDLLLSIGGDGTILNSALIIKGSEIPILGINLGRLGFLAIIEKNRIVEAIDNIITGNYTTENRSLIELNTNEELFGEENFALNDSTVHKSSSSSVIIVHTYLNEKFLNTYWVDGLIVSTPTGSTGYSLSCGGPIVFPGSGNFIITPVAPHNLTMRPIVIPDNSEISFEVESRADSFLCTLDSRYKTITPKHKLTIKKSKFSINLIVFEGYDFSANIQNKLNWGKDKRN